MRFEFVQCSLQFYKTKMIFINENKNNYLNQQK